MILSGKVHQNAQESQREPTSDYKYVVQPGHPLYGTLVKVLSIRKSATYIRCVIADPNHPSFHYHVRQRWLSDTKPERLVPAKGPDRPVAITLPALDKLVQYVLSQQELRRTSDHVSEELQRRTALADNPTRTEEVTEPSSVSPGEEDNEQAVS